MGSTAAYARFGGERARRVRVTLSREAWGGKDVPGNVALRVVTDGRVSATRRLVLHRLQRRTLTVPVPPPPFRIEVSVSPTFSPARFGFADTRELGAQVTFQPLASE
jgi:hypothetical protein